MEADELIMIMEGRETSSHLLQLLLSSLCSVSVQLEYESQALAKGEPFNTRANRPVVFETPRINSYKKYRKLFDALQMSLSSSKP